jgi:hypothetical protein
MQLERVRIRGDFVESGLVQLVRPLPTGGEIVVQVAGPGQ